MFKYKTNIKINVELDCKTKYKYSCFDDVKSTEHNLGGEVVKKL